MASLKDLRSRIASTKNTQKITSAMKVTSAAKLRRAQSNISALRPYAQSILTLIADIASTQKVEHGLLSTKKKATKILLVVLTSDRGLCGAFNTNVSKFAESYFNEHKNEFETFNFIFVGRKVTEFFKRRNVEAVDNIPGLANTISYELAEGLAERLIADYLTGNYDEVRFIYNEFKSAIAQNVVCEQILPVNIEGKTSIQKTDGPRFSDDIIFEPEPAVIIDDLLKKHFTVQVYRCLSESVASEHGARMTAMENATKNAGEMIRSLSLTYNKVRQAAITKEIIEITSGAEAL